MASGRAWPVVALSAAAWVLVVVLDHSVLVPYLCASNAMPVWTGLAAFAAAISVNAPGAQALSWFVMLLAMMTPLLWQPLAHVWDRSLAERRVRAVLLFLGSYLGAWMLAMAVLALAAVALRIVAGSAAIAFAIAAGVAMLWQMTPAKALLLNRCHALRPLPAFGLAADIGSLRYGFQVAAPCIGTCWAMMLLPLTGDTAHIVVMVMTALWMLSERYSGRRPFDLFAWARACRSLVGNDLARKIFGRRSCKTSMRV
jgi:predicted metal-binding membrane protein